MKFSKLKLIVSAITLVMLLSSLVPILTGCGSSIDVDTSGMYLVVYDGNGGYLGNKSSTVRKLFCQPGSKIPSYPVTYSENQYTVSSLGLAMRDGYNLLGWYASDAATYKEAENGEYVYLSADEGNGIFEIDPNGEYVRKYEKAENGEYVYVHVEEAESGSEGEAVENTYVFINSVIHVDNEENTEETDVLIDEETAETAEDTEEAEDAVAEETGETAEDAEGLAEEAALDVSEEETDGEDAEEPEDDENVIVLSVESGFYICNGDETINEIDDENLRDAYRAAYEEKTYTASQLTDIAGWQKLDEIPKSFAELFADLEKYDYAFAKAEEGDEGLDRYSIESGYASLYSIFVEDEKGGYVFESPYYNEYNADENAGGQRYSINDRYVFTAVNGAENPSYLKRYDATMDYWDFENDKVNEEDCEWDGEKYVLTLNAHWVKKTTVFYHYENALGQVDESFEKLLADNYTSVLLKPGETIGKKETVPKDNGRTFVCWSKTPGEYDPWDFQNEVFPEGESELHLYAYYVDGEYTRIVSASGLSAVGKDPAGKYLLVNDIDFGEKEITGSPLGLTSAKAFTGEFISFGKKITNFKFKLAPSKQQAMDSSIVSEGSLFPLTCGAKISGISVEGEAVLSGLKAIGARGGAKKDILFAVSGLIGKAVMSSGDASGVTTVDNCNVKLDIVEKTEGALNSDGYNYIVNYGAVSAYSSNGAIVLNGTDAAVNCELDGSYTNLIESSN